MRVLRDCRQHCICAGQITYIPSPTPQRTSLSSSVGNFWGEWQIQCLILVSFGLQVFLFMAAGMRRRITSRILRSLLWLAYLSADSVAIFVLGHLALHASGPEHQLLFFWAPFVLLHLGGQDNMTAFSMQDNDLWTRHLLGLVTQVAAAGYVVSRISWPDRRLLAAMVLMFISGCFKYAERTLCLYRASPALLRQYSLFYLDNTAANMLNVPLSEQEFLTEKFTEMVKANGRRHSSRTFGVSFYSSGISLVSDNPLNDQFNYIATHHIESFLQGLKSNEERCRVYNYVSIRPILIYECLYTKARLRFSYIRGLDFFQIITETPCDPNPTSLLESCLLLLESCLLFKFLIHALLLFSVFLSTSTALVLFFKVVEKGQLYSRADVTVSYILLIGAMILEIASLLVSIISYLDCRDIFQSGRKQWSEMLGQYNMTKSLTTQDTTCIMPFLRQWIGKHLDDNTSRIPISNDLKKLVLDKLCEFGARKQDWNFASFHGKLSLGKWKDKNKDSVSTGLETPLNSSISDLDLPTSVLILHIATDILYFHENKRINSEQQTLKKMSRELSNYMMYLVFKCGVMLTTKTKLMHERAQKEMKRILEEHINLREKEAITRAFEANRGHGSLSEQAAEMLLLTDKQAAQMVRLMETFIAVSSSLFPRASDVAHELIHIYGEEDYWELVAAVWVEMLYYIAPRCGGPFHSHHLTTGGEFITQVLFLMHLLGPFLPPPSA